MMGTCKECKYFTKMTDQQKEPMQCWVMAPFYGGYEDNDMPVVYRFPCQVREDLPACEKFSPKLH